MKPHTIEFSPAKGYEKIGDITMSVHGHIPGATEFSEFFKVAWADGSFDEGPVPIEFEVSAGAGCGSSRMAVAVTRGDQHYYCTLDIRELVGPVVDLALGKMEEERVLKGLCPDCGGTHGAGRCSDYDEPIPSPKSTPEPEPMVTVLDEETTEADDYADLMTSTSRPPIEEESDEIWEDDVEWMTITLPYDVHARVVAGVIRIGMEYDATVLLRHDGLEYSTESFMKVMENLGGKVEGNKIDVGVYGPDKRIARAQVLQSLTQDFELMERGPRGPDSPFDPRNRW